MSRGMVHLRCMEKQKKGWPKTRKLTLREKNFCQEYVKNGHIGSRAAMKAYTINYKNKAAAASATAAKYLKKPKIQKYIATLEEKIIDEATPSLMKLAHLRDKGETEKIQMDSSKAMIDAAMQTLNRLEKRYEITRGTSSNIIVAELSDKDLEERIRKELKFARAVSGAIEAEVQERPDLPDGRDPGVQEFSSNPFYSSEYAEYDRAREEERALSSTERTSEEHDDNNKLYDAEDTKGSEHQDTDNERSP